MTLPGWQVVSWPPRLCQADSTPALQLVHLGTEVSDEHDDDVQYVGYTVWGSDGPDGIAGMAWDWVQIPQGVVTLADPLALITNLWLVDPQGQVLSPTQAAPRLNEIVHTLPWQDEVQRVIRAHRHARPAGVPRSLS